MTIKRINEFPEGSGSLSNDDVFLFMDDPSGSGVTKKISLSQIADAIGGGEGGNPFDQDLNTTNFPSFSGVSLSNGTTLAQGTFDNSTGGQSGISLNCYVGYELNWQGGHLKSTSDGGITSANIWCDSAIEFIGSGIHNVEINNSGITFSDGTTQATAWTGSILSSQVNDFNSSVSGLLPVIDLLAGTGINISSSSGTYTIGYDLAYNIQAASLATTVFNKTGSPIPKFTAVYINGGQGDNATITKAQANTESTSSKTYGITAEAISHMSTGKVIVIGALTGVDTDQFNPTAPTGNVNGTSLWLSPTVAGGITTTKPSAPNHVVYLGTIVRTHQNEGIVQVRIQNGYEIEELHNVDISGVSHNDILVYNSGTKLWENNSNAVFSNPSGITGATAITNIIQISQANFNNIITPDPNTLYVIND